MRGKAGRLLQSKGHHRITPAYAGKRQLGTRQKSENKDHPRLCGEKCSRRASSSPIAGSPPPMRGKVPFCCSIGIPSEDHPRLCGEKQHCTNSPAEQRGSPPPMRGKDLSIYVAGIERRITPAYAGKSANVTLAGSSGRDHPRLCGEKIHNHLNGYSIPGSPPPMRGKGQLLNHFLTDCRITPAYAGKRPPKSTAVCCLWDHPRLCGEKRIAK